MMTTVHVKLWMFAVDQANINFDMWRYEILSDRMESIVREAKPGVKPTKGCPTLVNSNWIGPWHQR